MKMLEMLAFAGLGGTGKDLKMMAGGVPGTLGLFGRQPLPFGDPFETLFEFL